MRITAVLFIAVTLVANFIYNNITSLVVAMFSFPVLLVVLLKKKKRQKHLPSAPQPVTKSEDRFE